MARSVADLIAKAAADQSVRLDLSGLGLTELPAEVGNLTALTQLDLDGNQLTALPPELANLTSLTALILSGNQLTALPRELGNLTALTALALDGNQLTALPRELGNLTSLTALALSGNQLTALPPELGNLTSLSMLDLSRNQLTALPPELGNLTALTHLYMYGNQLTALPAELGNLTALQLLALNGNQLTALPPELGSLRPGALAVERNRLAPEVMAAYEAGGDELSGFLRILRDPVAVTEAKLVLVGEGKVGKTSLREAMAGGPWVEERDTTHGVEIAQVTVTHAGENITMNVWDFGGQDWYRPTHQLYFTAPAVYLLLWVPRLGPGQCAVMEWLKTIRARAGVGARVHVVATHADRDPNPADIDAASLRREFGEMIVDFHHIDSSNPDHVARLMAAVAATADQLPHLRRQYPRTWHDLREAIRAEGLTYLPYPEYLKLAKDAGLTETSARSLARNAHALGNWIFFDDAVHTDLVIFKPDWLSKAIGHVIKDPQVRIDQGLITVGRMSQIWAALPEEERYPQHLHAAFRDLMAAFDIAYRVASRPGEPQMMLIAQHVDGQTPDLSGVWGEYEGASERSQVCQIRDKATRRPDVRDGLMYRLIVRFHEMSLGVEDHNRSVHWQNGIVLDIGIHGRALMRLDGHQITVTVRAAYPHYLLAKLTDDIRTYIEDFWQGLEVRVMVPCAEHCPIAQPGDGLFNTEALIKAKNDGETDIRCGTCDESQDIDALMLNVVTRRVSNQQRYADAIGAVLDEKFAPLLHLIHREVTTQGEQTRAAISQMELHYRELINALDDPARDGPRLITVERVPGSVLAPGWTHTHLRLTLWCEHARRPVNMLGSNPNAGVYTVDVPKETLVKAAPVLTAISRVLRGILPAAGLLDVALPESAKAWTAISERLQESEKTIEGLAQLTGQPMDARVEGRGELDQATLRVLHDIIRKQDPGFGGLHRVNDRGRYRWIHPDYLHHYRTAG